MMDIQGLSDKEDVDDKQAYLALKDLFDAQSEQLKKQEEHLDRLSKKLNEAFDKIADYEEKVKQLNQRLYGRSTECSKPVSNQDISSVLNKTSQKKPRGKKKGRLIDTTHLPTYEQRRELSAEEQVCPHCGGDMYAFGETNTETLEVLPHQHFVKKEARLKYLCKGCRKIKQAPVSETSSPLKKSIAANSFIANAIVNKYAYHQPVYRQSKQLKSQGLEIPDNTLGRWLMASAEQLSCLLDACWSELLSSEYLQVDETPLQVLSQHKKGYIWVYLMSSSQGQLVLYDYQPTRSKSAVEHRLSTYRGRLQTDGYAGYNTLRDGEQIEGFGCMAHCRRKFMDVIKVAAGAKGVATDVVQKINELYQIEQQARYHQLTAKDRQVLREEKALPILDNIFHLVKEANAPPNSGLGRAINYTLNQWSYLKKYVHDGEVEIDNNRVENAIRLVALGRRNWLFSKHDKGATLSGFLYSLVESAKRNHLPQNGYIHYLLTQVTALRRKTIDPVSLLPHRIDREKVTAFVKDYQLNAQKALLQAI